MYGDEVAVARREADIGIYVDQVGILSQSFRREAARLLPLAQVACLWSCRRFFVAGLPTYCS